MRRKPEVWLLDTNLLFALVHESHVHHGLAHRWFDAVPQRRWASCVLTRLAFLRLTINPKVAGATHSAAEASGVLKAMTSDPAHVDWADAPEPSKTAELVGPAVVDHRQITDAYLLSLVVARGQCLATLDRGLAGFAAATGRQSHLECLVDDRSETTRRARR